MSKRQKNLAILAAFLVLFSAMWDPRISAGVAIIALAGLGVYHLLKKTR